ncbi:MAG: DNA alkylation repair protein [Bacteroidales bacterium]
METEIHPFWLELYSAFQQNANAEKAAWGKAYLRNQFEIFGLTGPVRSGLIRDFIQKNKLPQPDQTDEIIRNAWNLPEREMQYACMEVLFRQRKKSSADSIRLYEWMITHKSWWDTVDYIAPNLVGNLFVAFPELRDKTLEKWMNSGNFWLQRSCLLFQLKYKSKTDSGLLLSLCTQLAGEKEFFIRKAIGWSLREYAKTNPEAVKSFVDRTVLSGLSRREALKHF